VTLSTPQAGVALASASEEALRLWRSACRAERRTAFRALMDDLVEPFARRVGETLAAGAPPEEVWPAIWGVARLPRNAAEEIQREWALAGEVVAAIADALHAGPEAREHALAAAREASRRTLELVAASPAPPGPVLAVRVIERFDFAPAPPALRSA